MGADRRFFALENENSVFKFKIDTRNIAVGATDGSQNPLTFCLPFPSVGNSAANCIVKVSDGRPDISIVGQAEVNSKRVLSFTVSGIYDITIIGRVPVFTFYTYTEVRYDYRKIIEINIWGKSIGYGVRCFSLCVNLRIKAENTLRLPSDSYAFFANIAGIDVSMNTIDTSDVTSAISIISNVPNSFPLNPFWSKITEFSSVYQNSIFDSSVTKVEIISDSITSCSRTFFGTNFKGRIIMKTPNLATVNNFLQSVTNPPSLGEIDIRNLTSCTNFMSAVMSTSNVDSTLTGWVNNFDWSGIAPVINKVTIDFVNSKYSNNPSVIAAKAFLEAKGYVFTRLTMV